MTPNERPCRIISSVAPIRIADFGGWTDTWFAKFGRVLSIAVHPCSQVQLRVFARQHSRPLVTIYAENYGERYTMETLDGSYGRHPLLEATVEFMGVPRGRAIEIDVFSAAPAGGSTGTSAAVSVALIGALDRMTPGRLAPNEVARAAHRIETELLHQQCGVQDQLASAYGGVNFIQILDYPHAIVSPLRLPAAIKQELGERLSLVFLGQSHSSSKVHERVIAELADAGPDAEKLRPLRRTPLLARDALLAGDFHSLGRAMIENTEAQANLHAGIVSPRHQAVIEVARRRGAIGWKVNGAGGDGGSITLLGGPKSAENRQMLKDIIAEVHGTQSIPIYLSPLGLQVWELPLAEELRQSEEKGDNATVNNWPSLS